MSDNNTPADDKNNHSNMSSNSQCSVASSVSSSSRQGSGMIRDYKGAVALNRIGLSLLERRAYKEALNTLKDAILIMRALPHFKDRRQPTDEHENCTTDSQSSSLIEMHRECNGEMTKTTSSSIEEKLRRATQRLSNPTVLRSSAITDVHFCDNVDLGSLQSAFHYGQSSSVIFPIHIDCGNSTEVEDAEIDLESAILLYNFGIAHMCMATATKNTATRQKLWTSALKLYHSAQDILFAHSSNCEDSFNQNRLLLVGGLVLQNIIQILCLQGKVDDADHYNRRMESLRNLIEELMDSDPFSQSMMQAPAAATA